MKTKIQISAEGTDLNMTNIKPSLAHDGSFPKRMRAQRLAGKLPANLFPTNILIVNQKPDSNLIFAAALAGQLDPRVGRLYSI